MLLGLGGRVHNWLLFAVSNTIPLAVTLCKMIWRYYSRVEFSKVNGQDGY